MSQKEWYVEKEFSEAPPLAFAEETEATELTHSGKHMSSQPPPLLTKTSTPLCTSSWSLSLQPLATTAKSTTYAAAAAASSSTTATPASLNIMKNDADGKVEKLVKLPCSVSLCSFTEQKSDVFSRSGDGNSLLLEGVETFMVGEYNLTACPICLEHFTFENPAIIVKCEHGFHLQCLESWRQRSNHCPLCLKLLDDNDGRLMNTRDYRRRRRYDNVNEVKMHLMLEQCVNREECETEKCNVIENEKKKLDQKFNVSNFSDRTNINNVNINNVSSNDSNNNNNNVTYHNENTILLDEERGNWFNHIIRNFRLHECINAVWHRYTNCCARVDWREVEEEEEIEWNAVERYLQHSNNINGNNITGHDNRRRQPPDKIN